MPKSVNNDRRLDLRLPKELVSAAKEKADQEKRSISEVVRELLRGWVRKPAK